MAKALESGRALRMNGTQVVSLAMRWFCSSRAGMKLGQILDQVIEYEADSGIDADGNPLPKTGTKSGTKSRTTKKSQ
jgi:hypothetical protein